MIAATLKLEAPAEAKAGVCGAGSPQPVISVRNLSKDFGGGSSFFGLVKRPAFRAVDNVSLDLFPGKKPWHCRRKRFRKDLGRMLMGVIEPTSGSIGYLTGDGGEKDVLHLSRRELKAYHTDVRMIFQDPFASLNPRMTLS